MSICPRLSYYFIGIALPLTKLMLLSHNKASSFYLFYLLFSPTPFTDFFFVSIFLQFFLLDIQPTSGIKGSFIIIIPFTLLLKLYIFCYSVEVRGSR